MSDASSARPIRIGARTSPLARAQVDLVAALLAEQGIPSTFVGVTTTGDVDQRQLTEIGGTGVFASAVRDALHRGEIDVAVHSLKDLPTAVEAGLEVIAIPRREDTRDVLIGRRLIDLVDGTRIGTGAPRRAVQLEDWAIRHGLQIKVVPIRGNVDTRIELVRSGTVDAVVLAAAGLHRLGYLELPESGSLSESTNGDTVVKGLCGEILDHDLMLPAPGQGALGLEIHHSLSIEFRTALTLINNPLAQAEALVERSFLATLEAGCTAPVGARAHVKSVRGTSLDLTLAAVVGRTLLSNLSEPTKTDPVLRIDACGTAVDPAQFGSAQAGGVLAELITSND